MHVTTDQPKSLCFKLTDFLDQTINLIIIMHSVKTCMDKMYTLIRLLVIVFQDGSRFGIIAKLHRTDLVI